MYAQLGFAPLYFQVRHELDGVVPIVATSAELADGSVLSAADEIRGMAVDIAGSVPNFSFDFESLTAVLGNPNLEWR